MEDNIIPGIRAFVVYKYVLLFIRKVARRIFQIRRFQWQYIMHFTMER